ncbi:DUF2339 domain-containing protein, partial [bacterium]|nr:DUF2339 domain-containing protein [bacterium]
SILMGFPGVLYLLNALFRALLLPSVSNSLSAPEKKFVGSMEDAIFISSVFGGIWLWYILPPPALAIGWGIMALILIEASCRWRLPLLRQQGHFFAVITFARVFVANLSIPGATAGISHRALTIIPLIIFFCHLFSRCSKDPDGLEYEASDKDFVKLYLFLPTILAAVAIRFEFGRYLAAPAWGIFSVILLGLGNHWDMPDLRRQSILLACVSVFQAWTTDLFDPQGFSFHSNRWFIGGVMITSLYICQFLFPRSCENLSFERTNFRDFLDVNSSFIFSILASFLLAFLLYLEVSGKFLTAAWGAQGVLLLFFGFPLRQKILRYSGLSLLFLCMIKLFVYDLRELNQNYRVFSFVILGFILVGISWVYSRFHEKIKEYL